MSPSVSAVGQLSVKAVGQIMHGGSALLPQDRMSEKHCSDGYLFLPGKRLPLPAVVSQGELLPAERGTGTKRTTIVRRTELAGPQPATPSSPRAGIPAAISQADGWLSNSPCGISLSVKISPLEWKWRAKKNLENKLRGCTWAARCGRSLFFFSFTQLVDLTFFSHWLTA